MRRLSYGNSHEARNRGEHISDVLESVQINRSTPRYVAGQWQSGPDGQTRDDEAAHDDEADHADCPAETYDGDEMLKEDGEDDSADSSSTEDDPDPRRATAAEPVTNYCD